MENEYVTPAEDLELLDAAEEPGTYVLHVGLSTRHQTTPANMPEALGLCTLGLRREGDTIAVTRFAPDGQEFGVALVQWAPDDAVTVYRAEMEPELVAAGEDFQDRLGRLVATAPDAPLVCVDADGQVSSVSGTSDILGPEAEGVN